MSRAVLVAALVIVTLVVWGSLDSGRGKRLSTRVARQQFARAAERANLRPRSFLCFPEQAPYDIHVVYRVLILHDGRVTFRRAGR